MNKNLLIGLGVLIAVVLVGAYFVKSPKVGNTPTQKPVASALPEGPINEISISGKEYGFTPASISVKKGENVKIVFTNDGSFPHNLTIADLGLATKTLNSGDSDSIEFVADKAGTFEFHCSIDSHKDRGMTGTIVVK